MRKYVFPFACAVGLMLAACLTAPAEPTANSGSALSCTPAERAFNGACRKTCTTSSDCASPSSCMVVSAGVALCVDYSACAYLGSDTECAGVPYGGYGYSSYDSFDPYWTPTYDPYASSYNSYGSSYGSSNPFGCGGNAVWSTAPASAANDPRCGQPHAVSRCQKVGSACALVSGTTMDVADALH